MADVEKRVREAITLLQRKTNVDFILSLRDKKTVTRLLSDLYIERCSTPLLLTLLSLVNVFMLYSPEIEKLYEVLCKRKDCSKIQLASTASITCYPTVETMPYPYMEKIRNKMSDSGLVLGDYYSYTIYVMRILGILIGFVFTRVEQQVVEEKIELVEYAIVYTFSDSIAIEEVFKNNQRYKHISFEKSKKL